MKKFILVIIIIIPHLGFCQVDSTFSKQKLLSELELFEIIESTPECRVIYQNDSILRLAVIHDVTKSFNSTVKKYYRIGNAAGIRIGETQKCAIEKYNLLLEYTHCTSCRYQREYNKVFENLYLQEYKINLRKIIFNLEKEAQQQMDAKRKRK